MFYHSKQLLISLSSIIFFAFFANAGAAAEQASSPTLSNPDSSATVYFIRRSVFMGDGWNYDVWDGDKYVGLLGAGTILRYDTTSGEHLFLLMARGIHVWAYMKAQLSGNEEYFARAYPIPFSLQGVDANSDTRINEWRHMRPAKKLSEKYRSKVLKKSSREDREALAAWNAGGIDEKCALWYPPHKDGKARKQPSKGTGECRATGQLKPEFGVRYQK